MVSVLRRLQGRPRRLERGPRIEAIASSIAAQGGLVVARHQYIALVGRQLRIDSAAIRLRFSTSLRMLRGLLHHELRQLRKRHVGMSCSRARGAERRTQPEYAA